ncbi:MAG: class I SAM-dependent rRNA methyltransferase [Tateyamaria sp.]|jgi:23S rRNA (cytosine1962-C5)-methyltransferase|nr:class I SAM-dependent rRNA methyltransferase [Tateyamaria sp.]MDG1336287.1 class I SAM-dependent rRNA methyltransferase [Tateyamaria sp.]MDG2056692.1 class I SAM-dependent rRNA methyltransferase [Tateyamaria sp.]
MTTPSLSSSTTRPHVRMRPKTDARRIRHGFPWAYANEIVTDRRTKALVAGTLVVLEDENRNPLGLAAVNPASKIFVRMLDANIEAEVDHTWFVSRLRRALALRDRLFDAPFYRLIHAEADGLPGVVIDRFGDTLVIQPNAAWADGLINMLASAAAEVTGATRVLKNSGGRARSLEGLDDVSATLIGTEIDEPIAVSMNGATYMADVLEGQKTGLFYDQRPNHAFAKSVAGGARVLDVFSHVGGFGLAALAGGAVSTLCVDGSEPALALARQGAVAMGAEQQFEARHGDAFSVLQALNDSGDKFDLVVCDPPAFAPARSALDAGLRAYERIARLAAPLVAEGGILGLCSCSHAADLAKFRTACVRGIGRAGRQQALIHTGFAGADHPLLPQLAESGYLKTLFFRL